MMYIHPFVAGILATLFAELIALVLGTIIINVRRDEDDEI